MDPGIDTQEYAAQANDAVNSIRSKKDEKKKAWCLKIAPGKNIQLSSKPERDSECWTACRQAFSKSEQNRGCRATGSQRGSLDFARSALVIQVLRCIINATSILSLNRLCASNVASDMDARVFRRDMRRHMRPSFKPLREGISNAGSAVQNLVTSAIFRRTRVILVMVWLEREKGKLRAMWLLEGSFCLSDKSCL